MPVSPGDSDPQGPRLSNNDPAVGLLIGAIQAGDLASVRRALAERPEGARARLVEPEDLLALGADLNGTPSWGDGTPLDAAASVDTAREALLGWLREHGARRASKPTGEG